MNKWIGLLCACVLVIPAQVSGLGVGEVELHSALNETLIAEVELLSVSPEELPSVVVSLASAEMFEQRGLDRPYFLNSLRFSLASREDGSTFIEVTSRIPVMEPFLSFLMVVDWPQGRMVREFTLLLDLPVVAAAPPVLQAPVSTYSGQPETVEPEVVAAPIALSAPTSFIPTYTIRTIEVSSDEEYGPTNGNDTLWRIAEKVRSDETLTIEQTMMALYRANPSAFIGGNVNRLKRGEVLVVPSSEDIRTQGARDARSEFYAHMKAWRSQTTAPAPVAEITQVDEGASLIERADEADIESAIEAGEVSVAAADTAPLLRLVAPDNVAEEFEWSPEVAAAGNVKSETPRVDDQRTQQIEAELALATEQVATVSAENADLNSRLRELEDQVARMERLLTVESAAIAEVQDTMAANSLTAEGSTKSLLSSPAQLGVAGVVVLTLLILSLLWVRRQRQKDVLLDATGMASASSVHTDSADNGSDAKMVKMAYAEARSLVDIAAIEEDAGNVDPISEANVYIAYGRYQQAEDLVQDALQSEPENHEYRAKLLEVYHATSNLAAFTALALELGAAGLALLETASRERVLKMTEELCPEQGLFQDYPGGTASDPVEEGDVGIDLSGMMADEEADDEETNFANSALGIDDADDGSIDGSIDFDTDFDLLSEVEAASDTSSSVSSDDDGLEYEMDTPVGDDISGAPSAVENEAVSTKLDLARAYLEVGDTDGARSILDEVLAECSEHQRQEAEELMRQIS